MDYNDIKAQKENAKLKAKQNAYYIVIGVVTLVATVFLPMVGSTLGLKWAVPDTTVGWIVWGATKLCMAVINVLIYFSFMQQAKVNVKEDSHYKEAVEILNKQTKKYYRPKAPDKWLKIQYGRKGTTIFLSTAAATVAFSQALLSYDWMTLVTYAFTLVMGIVWGVIQMFKAEEYWTNEFYDYAKEVQANGSNT